MAEAVAHIETAPVPTSRRHSLQFSLSEVKRAITSIGSSRHSRTGSLTNPSTAAPNGGPPQSRSRGHTISSIVVPTPSSSVSQDFTPPLTPDSPHSPTTSNSNSLFSVSSPNAITSTLKRMKSVLGIQESITRSKQELEQIREGKKPQYNSIPESIIDDTLENPSSMSSSPTLVEEWLGLGYAIEMSRVESQLPDISSENIGEFSRSYQSWVTIHKGLFHPMFEEQEFRRWQKWHRALDRHAEKRRIERTLKFLEYSKEMSAMYLDERMLREWMLLYNEGYGDPLEVGRVKENLEVLDMYRPDPYVPAPKHDLPWLLKRSLSLSCLRDLGPLPDLDR